MDIPEIILEYAEKHGCNSVEYIGKRRGKEAFGMGYVDEDGFPTPTGLPTLYLYDGKTIEVVSGEEALDLL